MYKFETMVRPGREAERVTTAFYRFLELQSPSNACAASVQTEVLGDQEMRTVHLWSQDAVQDFQRYLAAFNVPPPSGLLPSFRARRVEDL